MSLGVELRILGQLGQSDTSGLGPQPLETIESLVDFNQLTGVIRSHTMSADLKR